MPQQQQQQGADPNQSTLSWMGESKNVMDLVGRFIGIKQHKQEQAMGQIQNMMTLANSGFPIDEKALTKYIKQAKLPISTDPEDLKAWKATIEKQQRGEDPSGTQTQQGGQQQPGGGVGPAPAGSTPEVKALHDAHAEITSTGKPLTKERMMTLQLNALAGRARTLMNTKATTEQQKAENERDVESLKAKAIAGDNNARGRLMQLGEIKFDFDQEKWNKMTDKQKTGMFDLLAGNESNAAKAERGQRIGESLISSGRLTDPAMAYQAGSILANGGLLPPEMQKAMKKYTFSEMVDQAKMMDSLVNLGVPPNKIGQVMQSAAAGGLENALPTGMKPLAFEAMKLEGKKVGLESQRLEIELARYNRETEIAKRMELAEMRKGMTDEMKSNLEMWKSLVEAKKAGGSVPDDLLKGATIKAADALNMDVKEVDSFTKTVTGGLLGGTKLEMTPRLSKETQSTVDNLSGVSTRTIKKEETRKQGPGAVSKFLSGVGKRIMEGPEDEKDKDGGI